MAHECIMIESLLRRKASRPSIICRQPNNNQLSKVISDQDSIALLIQKAVQAEIAITVLYCILCRGMMSSSSVPDKMTKKKKKSDFQ